jgi:hypothetical protein
MPAHLAEIPVGPLLAAIHDFLDEMSGNFEAGHGDRDDQEGWVTETAEGLYDKLAAMFNYPASPEDTTGDDTRWKG